MRFTKMHGLGNCYIYVNCFEERVTDAPALARAMSDRNTGVGSDGLILICPPGGEVAGASPRGSRLESTKAGETPTPRKPAGETPAPQARMIMYNMDGSRGQMCGNAIRCVGKYVYDHGLAHANPMCIETDAGLRTLDLTIEEGKVTHARVDMGPPLLRPEDLPANMTADQMVDFPIEVLGRPAKMTCVSMGNPHAVIYGVPLRELSPTRLAEAGRKIECHDLFPERTNVHFAEVVSESEVNMLIWERGSGATAACGTGACACCVAGVLTGRSGRNVTVNLPGGPLAIAWNEPDNRVYMTGPAVEIFSGDWPD